MRTLRPKGVEIELEDKKYNLIFDINVIDDIQEKFNAPIHEIISSMLGKERTDQMKSFKVFRYILTSLVNSDIKYKDKNAELYDEYDIGGMFNLGNLGEYADSIVKAYLEQTKKYQTEDDESPNVVSGSAK